MPLAFCVLLVFAEVVCRQSPRKNVPRHFLGGFQFAADSSFDGHFVASVFGFVFKNWWLGVIYVLIIPLIVVFEWLYTRWLMKLIDQYTYLLGDKLGKIAKIHKLRDELKIDISKL